MIVALLDTGSRRMRLTPSFARGGRIDTVAPLFHHDEPIYGTGMNKLVPRIGPIGEVRAAATVFADAKGRWPICLCWHRIATASRPCCLVPI